MLDNYGYVHALRMCNTAFGRQQWFRERTPVLLLCVHFLSCTFYIGNPLLTVSDIAGSFVWSLKSRNWLMLSLRTYSDRNVTRIFILAFQTRINVYVLIERLVLFVALAVIVNLRHVPVHVTAYNNLYNKMRQERDAEFWHGNRHDSSSRKITLYTLGYYEMGFKRMWWFSSSGPRKCLLAVF